MNLKIKTTEISAMATASSSLSRIVLMLALTVLITDGLPAAPPFQPTSTSQLWGSKGELWNPQGRLSDFSFAG